MDITLKWVPGCQTFRYGNDVNNFAPARKRVIKLNCQ